MYLLLVSGYSPGGDWTKFEMFHDQKAAELSLDRQLAASKRYREFFGPVIGPIVRDAVLFKVEPLAVYPPTEQRDGSVPNT